MRRDKITVQVDGWQKDREVTISMADLEVESYGHEFEGDAALDQLVEAIESLSINVTDVAQPEFIFEEEEEEDG